MYRYLAEFTGTDQTRYLTPCETDWISVLWCWAHYETLLHLGHTGLNIWVRFTLRLNTQARKTRYTRYFTKDHPLVIWYTGSYTDLNKQTTSNDQMFCTVRIQSFWSCVNAASLLGQSVLLCDSTNDDDLITKPLLKNSHCLWVNTAPVYTTILYIIGLSCCQSI